MIVSLNVEDPRVIELLRKAGPARRAELALRLSDEVRAWTRCAVEAAGGDPLQCVELWYGAALADRVRDCIARRR